MVHEDWREFEGVRGVHLYGHFLEPQTKIIIWRKRDGYAELTNINLMDSDGWNRGRNEKFDMWMIVHLPI